MKEGGEKRGKRFVVRFIRELFVTGKIRRRNCIITKFNLMFLSEPQSRFHTSTGIFVSLRFRSSFLVRSNSSNPSIEFSSRIFLS